jgi:hypothetical protein
MKPTVFQTLQWRTVLGWTVVSTVLFAAIGIYALPRVITLIAQNRLTSAVVTHEGKAPVNQISHVHRLATADDHVIVRPNNDTFYSSTWMDLSNGPIVVTVPAMGERYYSLQLMDVWTNAFAYIGQRATGAGRGQFAIVGPDWNGSLPEGMKKIVAPGNTVWMIGRTMVFGKDDIATASALQEQMTLAPLSALQLR